MTTPTDTRTTHQVHADDFTLGEAKSKRQRKPGVRTLIKQAEKSGKVVESITTPDGHVLKFSEPRASGGTTGNEWDEALNGHDTH